MGVVREAQRAPGGELAGGIEVRERGVGLENSHTLRTLIESLDAFAWQADPNTLRVSFISHNADKVIGRKVDRPTAEPESWIKHIHPDDRDHFVKGLRTAAKEPGDHELEVRVVAPDGTVTWLRSIVRLIADRNGGQILEGVTVDITDRKEVEAELHATEKRYRKLAQRTAMLERRAFHDPLTGLPNRALWRNHLEHALRSARRAGTSCAVLMLDLDDFKGINDTLGHAVGDEALRAVGPRLRGALRDCDIVARLGGDEFVALLDDTEAEGAVRAAQRIEAALDEPLELEGHMVSIRGSIGIAVFPEHTRKAEELMRRADAAMYHAKQEGRGHATWGRTDQQGRGGGRIASFWARMRRRHLGRTAGGGAAALAGWFANQTRNAARKIAATVETARPITAQVLTTGALLATSAAVTAPGVASAMQPATQSSRVVAAVTAAQTPAHPVAPEATDAVSHLRETLETQTKKTTQLFRTESRVRNPITGEQEPVWISLWREKTGGDGSLVLGVLDEAARQACAVEAHTCAVTHKVTGK